jgi:hypothetical protein
MKRLMLTIVVLAGMATLVPNAQAGIFARWFGRPVMQPAPVVVAQPLTGYRAFTYQPAETVTVAPVYRGNTLQQHAFHNAAAKVLGTAN